MADQEKRWVVTDVANGRWVESLVLTPEKTGLGKPGQWRVTKRRLHGGRSEGVDIIEVVNGGLSYIIVPTRGMGLWKGRYQTSDLGWRAPVMGPVHPHFINVLDHGGLGWLQGFDECIVRCGLHSNGAPCQDSVPDNNGNPSKVVLPLHGRIANIPATYVEVVVRDEGGIVRIVVHGIVDEGMLFSPGLRLQARFSTVTGSRGLTLHDEVSNRADVPQELELLYHCNFGEPFLEQGSLLVAPSRRVAPRDVRAQESIHQYASYLGPTAGYVEQVYWHALAADRHGNTVTLLRNRAGNRAVVLRHNIRQLPCFAQWKNTVGRNDGYVTGLEPGTNLPNPKPFERHQGRVVTLAPGQRYDVDLTLEVQDTASGVAGVEREIALLARGQKPIVSATPVAAWSPGVE